MKVGVLEVREKKVKRRGMIMLGEVIGRVSEVGRGGAEEELLTLM